MGYGTAFDVEDAVMESDFILPIGKAKIQRAGTDISLVAHSIGVGFAMDAAELLAKEGISCEVVNLRSIRPLDMDTVNESVKKTGHAITVWEPRSPPVYPRALPSTISTPLL